MKQLRLLPFLIRGSRGLFLLATVVGAFSGLASTVLLVLLNSTLARDWDGVPWNRVAAFAGLCLLLPVSQLVSEHLLVRLAETSVHDMRLNLSRRILAAPLPLLQQLGAPRLLLALTHDVDTVSRSLVLLPVLCINGALIAGCLVYLGWLAPKLLLFLILALVLGAASYQLPLSWAMRQLRRAREERDLLYEHFRGLTDGTRELKLHARRREAFLNLLSATSQRLRRLNVTATTTFSASRGWGLLLFFVLVGGLVFFAPTAGGLGREAVTGYVLVLLYMLTPLQAVLTAVPELGRADIALRQVASLGLSLAAAPSEATGTPQAPPPVRSLELAGVTFAHRANEGDRHFAVGPIDLRLEPGELVFLTGGNGSGKTTLAHLLTGLYPPDAGEVRLNGEPLTTAEARESYRQLFTTVFANFFLFETLLGLDRPDLDADAEAWLARLRLSGKIQVQDGRFSTLALSQGQRKRLALLTAYLEDRAVYLFDEWAAEQDPVFRELFYLKLLPELRARGKVVLVISHDDRYYGVADRILKLDEGKLVEDQRTTPTDPATSGN